MSVFQYSTTKQKEDLTPGDWFILLKKDFEFIEVEMDDDKIKNPPKQEYKKTMKEKIKKAFFAELKNMKQNHSKIKEIKK